MKLGRGWEGWIEVDECRESGENEWECEKLRAWARMKLDLGELRTGRAAS